MHNISIDYLSKQLNTFNDIEKGVIYEITEENINTTTTYNVDALRILVDNTYMYLSGKLLAPIRIIPMHNIKEIFHTMSDDEDDRYRLGYRCEILLTDGLVSIQA